MALTTFNWSFQYTKEQSHTVCRVEWIPSVSLLLSLSKIPDRIGFYMRCFTMQNNWKKCFLSHSKRINYYCSLCASFHLFPDSHIRPTIQPGVLPLFMMCVMMLYPILFQMRSSMSFSLSLCSLLFILTGKWRLKGKANGLNLFFNWRFSIIAKEDDESLLFNKLQYI